VRAEEKRRAGDYDLSISLGKNLGQDLIRMGGGPLGVFWEKSARAMPRGLARNAKGLRRRLSPANRIIQWVE
jgi:UDP-glucose:(heptosyl)LPS alpha-1,3-glucosyltransferase